MHLTEETIAIELPDNCIHAKIGTENNILNLYSDKGYLDKIDLPIDCSHVIGVTPLSEEQWKEVVETEIIAVLDEDDNLERYDHMFKNYSDPRGFCKIDATQSGLSLLESKGLLNKKLAIIKIKKK